MRSYDHLCSQSGRQEKKGPITTHSACFKGFGFLLFWSCQQVSVSLYSPPNTESLMWKRLLRVRPILNPAPSSAPQHHIHMSFKHPQGLGLSHLPHLALISCDLQKDSNLQNTSPPKIGV